MKKYLYLFILLSFNLGFTSCGQVHHQEVEFIFVNGIEPTSLDPTQIWSIAERRIMHALFAGLTTYDKYGNVIPQLAESWQISDDGLTIIFNIRQGLTFSDGHPLTAHEVIASLQSMLNPATAWPGAAALILEYLDGEAALTGQIPANEARAWQLLDSYTIRHNRLTPIEVPDFGSTEHMIRPMHVVNAYGNQWTRPENFVASGPFTLQSWLPQDRLILVPNELYFNRSNVFIDKLVILALSDQTAAFNALRNGEVDWIIGIPPGLGAEPMFRDDWQPGPTMSTVNFAFNTVHLNLQDVRVRQALALAIDRAVLVALPFLAGGQLPVHGFVPLATTGAGPYFYTHLDNSNINNDLYNPQLARQLLAEAGFAGGDGLGTLTFLYNTNEVTRLIAEFVAHSWQTELGINVQLINMEWNSFLANRSHPDTQIFFFSWTSPANTPIYHLRIFMTGDRNNFFNYSNPQVDELLARALTLPVSQERTALMQQAEEIIIIEDQAVLPLFNNTVSNFINLDKWDGWAINPLNWHMWEGIRPR
ncbi:MAG: peptide ABC transporter substrate-binding protein [Spirochaetaceae bacterium]|nr:peptide ABC transporter substrate-binding protein [Spirochaetaceae bacterium]